jgi:formiminoglutamase
MNLRIFFDIVKEEIIHSVTEPNAWMNNVVMYRSEFPDWKHADIAIIGVVEDRGTPKNSNLLDGPDEIRKKLYNLNQGKGHYKIVDLGNLRCGMTLNESYLRMKEVTEVLLQHQTFPLFIGGGHDMDYGQFLGYEHSGKLVNILNVDAYVDMFGTDDFGSNRHHIHKILVHDPNIIFHYSHLAYQTYLCEPESIDVLEKLHFETFRIGAIHETIEEIEPVIRNADMMSFDITAIKKGDAPANNYAQPFGLTGEEACQICWYAGLNSKLSSAGFYEYNPHEDHKGQTAALIATMVWYLVEGFYLRKHTPDMNSNDYTKYIVSMQAEPHKLVFYKHNRTEKWWMEVPYASEKPRLARSSFVPCSYNDYALANKGEIPNRWILMHAKLI